MYTELAFDLPTSASYPYFLLSKSRTSLRVLKPLPETECVLDSEFQVIVKVYGDPLKSITCFDANIIEMIKSVNKLTAAPGL